MSEHRSEGAGGASFAERGANASDETQRTAACASARRLREEQETQ